MNLREIKKDIEYVLGAFIEDCSVVASVNPKASDEEVAKLMEAAAALYDELKDKVSEKPEGSVKAHFNAIRQDLLVKSNALYEQLSDVVVKTIPAE